MQEIALKVAFASAVVLVTALVFFFLTAKQASSLSKTEVRAFPLIKKTVISHNTAIYRFALKTKNAVLGLPTGQHIQIVAKVGDRLVTRSYTPVSNDSHRGYFDLLIKSYPEGVVSNIVNNLKIGDCINVKGPNGKFAYIPNQSTHITMIAGGTGITPMFQILTSILTNPLDTTRIRLIYANVTEADILLRKEVDAMVCKRFEVWYVLNEQPPGWKGGNGFVNAKTVEGHGYGWVDGEKRNVLICGPPGMVKAVVGICEEQGYPAARILSKLGDPIFKF